MKSEEKRANFESRSSINCPCSDFSAPFDKCGSGKQGQTEISQITQTCMGDEMAAGVDGNERDIGIGVAEL
jgi:hypothetical protein